MDICLNKNCLYYILFWLFWLLIVIISILMVKHSPNGYLLSIYTIMDKNQHYHIVYLHNDINCLFSEQYNSTRYPEAIELSVKKGNILQLKWNRFINIHNQNINRNNIVEHTHYWKIQRHCIRAVISIKASTEWMKLLINNVV